MARAMVVTKGNTLSAAGEPSSATSMVWIMAGRSRGRVYAARSEVGGVAPAAEGHDEHDHVVEAAVGVDGSAVDEAEADEAEGLRGGERLGLDVADGLEEDAVEAAIAGDVEELAEDCGAEPAVAVVLGDDDAQVGEVAARGTAPADKRGLRQHAAIVDGDEGEGAAAGTPRRARRGESGRRGLRVRALGVADPAADEVGGGDVVLEGEAPGLRDGRDDREEGVFVAGGEAADEDLGAVAQGDGLGVGGVGPGHGMRVQEKGERS